ncbi:hypothetical protein [uncultured Erythrobacter sp.]|uniref:hypothetical protein n=1 Tax=uncultured Erythrobacter sp. TaxID=263913 RepID=UPI002625613D|nr:hypothetical protein [uncultured Erythrobacter sp.]
MASNNIHKPVATGPQQPAFPVGDPALRRRTTLRPEQNRWAPFLKIAPVIILLIGLLLPVEVRLNFAGQTLYAYRLAWMLVAPWLFYQMLSGRFQLRFNDIIVGLACTWMLLSFVIVDGFVRGGAAGFAIALDVMIPYLVARQTIRTFNDLRTLLIALAPIAIVICGMMVLEAVSHTRFIRGGAQALFGSLGAVEYGAEVGQARLSDTRFGMLRATGPFSHPILAGVFFAALLPLYYFSRLRGWPALTGIAAGVGAIFSLSSAAFLGIGMFVLLSVYDRIRQVVVFLNWPIFIAALAALMTVLHVLSQNGLISVLIRFTFNPASGYYRLMIWEYGSRSVEAYPWFGIAYAQFKGLAWMNSSVDAVWLALAIRHGLPAPLLLGLAVIIAIGGLAFSASRDRSINSAARIGLAISLTMFFILGFTVSYFGGILIWFAMMIGFGTTFGRIVEPAVQRAPMRRQQVRPT